MFQFTMIGSILVQPGTVGVIDPITAHKLARLHARQREIWQSSPQSGLPAGTEKKPEPKPRPQSR